MAPIKVTVCGNNGHSITSLLSKETQIPNTPVWARQYEILCTQCGSSLEDIRKERTPRPSGSRSRPPKAQSSELQPVPAPMEA